MNSWSALDRRTTARPAYGHRFRFVRKRNGVRVIAINWSTRTGPKNGIDDRTFHPGTRRAAATIAVFADSVDVIRDCAALASPLRYIRDRGRRQRARLLDTSASLQQTCGAKLAPRCGGQ